MFTRGYLFVIFLVLIIKCVDLAAVLPDENNILNESTSEETVATDCTELEFVINNPSSSEAAYDYVSVPLCKSSTKRINPNDLFRARGYDIADDENFSQIIEVNVCDNVGAACNMYMPQIFKKTVCRQKTMKISLTVTLKNNKSFNEDFEIPSQCECATFNRISSTS